MGAVDVRVVPLAAVVPVALLAADAPVGAVGDPAAVAGDRTAICTKGSGYMPAPLLLFSVLSKIRPWMEKISTSLEKMKKRREIRIRV